MHAIITPRFRERGGQGLSLRSPGRTSTVLIYRGFEDSAPAIHQLFLLLVLLSWRRPTQATAAPSQAGGIYRQIGVQAGTATPNLEGSVTIESSILSDNLGTIGLEDLGQNLSETFANAISLNRSLVRNTGSIIQMVVTSPMGIIKPASSQSA